MITARASLALLLLAAAFAALFALLAPQSLAGDDTPAAVPSGGTATLSGSDAVIRGTGVGPDLAVLDAAAPAGGDLSPRQAAQALLAADRVCEGVTANVPEGFLIRTAATEGGLTPADAHRFVEAALIRCAAL